MCLLAVLVVLTYCSESEQAAAPSYDGVLLNGLVYDGRGGSPVSTDLAIKGGLIAAFGDFGPEDGAFVVNAEGKAVSPEGLIC